MEYKDQGVTDLHCFCSGRTWYWYVVKNRRVSGREPGTCHKWMEIRIFFLLFLDGPHCPGQGQTDKMCVRVPRCDSH